MTETPSPAITVRRLMRGQTRAALGTAQRDSDGAPYVSLAMVALDHDATPLLLLSDLADHTKNLRLDPRVSLLLDGTAGLDVPLTGERATLIGKAAISAEPRHKARYLARHPDAELYLGFKDFDLWAVSIERAHLVAGFGRIHWIAGSEILLTDAPAALASAEPEILAHMNQDHADAVQLYATRLLGRTGEGWTLTGLDPEGADLRRGGETARLGFDKPVADADGARVELVRLVKRARATPAA